MSRDIEPVAASTRLADIGTSADMAETPPPAGKAAHTLSSLLTLLRGRWKWALSVAGGAAVLAAVMGWFAGSKTYSSRAQLSIARDADEYGVNTGSNAGGGDFDAYLDMYVEMMRSSRVIDKAMDSDGWRSLNRPVSPQQTKRFLDNLLIVHKGQVISLEVRDSDPRAAMVGAHAVTEAFEKLSTEEESQHGKAKQDFFESELSRSINRLAQLDSSMKSRLGEHPGYENFGVDDLVYIFQAKMKESIDKEMQLRDARRELAARGLGPAGAGAAASQPAETANAVANPPTDAVAGKPAAPSSTPAHGDPTPDDIAVDNPQMGVLISQRRQLQSTLARISVTMGEQNGYYKEVQNDLRLVDQDIDDYTKRYMAAHTRGAPSWAATLKTQRLQEVEADLGVAVKDADDEVESITRLKHDVMDIREQIEQEKLNRDDIKKKITMQDRLSRVPSRISVLEAGTSPDAPATDTRPVLAAGGAFAGLAAGLGAALVVGFFDRRVRGVDDAWRAGLGQRSVLGVLPQLPENLSDPAEALRAARCVHQIRTTLQLWYGSMARPVFAVTGAAAGTGKTTLTLALGLSFSASRSRTLLIDLDLVGGGLTGRSQAVKRRPIGQILRRTSTVRPSEIKKGLQEATTSGSQLGQALVNLGFASTADIDAALSVQRSSSLGVLDVLEGELLSECVYKTEHPQLSILPLGDAGSHHAGTVSPLGLQRLVDAARAEYDIVLIDTGPVPGSLEGAAVAAVADGVILAVSRGDEMAALKLCWRTLRGVGAKVAGVVFNRVSELDLGHANAGSIAKSSEVANGEAGFGQFGRAVVMAGKSESDRL